MTYRVIVEPAAQRQMIKLGVRGHDPLVRAILDLRQNPRPQGSRKLVGSDHLWRIRVGQFRIIFSINDSESIIKVVRVVRRSEDTYRNLLN